MNRLVPYGALLKMESTGLSEGKSDSNFLLGEIFFINANFYTHQLHYRENQRGSFNNSFIQIQVLCSIIEA